MGDADGGVGRIDALATVAAGAVDVDAEVFLFNFEVFFGGFGKDGNSDGRRMDAALGLGNWDTLDAVDAAFKF